jgi:hypothetical protein
MNAVLSILPCEGIRGLVSIVSYNRRAIPLSMMFFFFLRGGKTVRPLMGTAVCGFLNERQDDIPGVCVELGKKVKRWTKASDWGKEEE